MHLTQVLSLILYGFLGILAVTLEASEHHLLLLIVLIALVVAYGSYCC